jgi:hypothetical protein
MATQVYTGGAPAARAGIDWILNPNIDFTETDTNAAEQAVGGGFSGSQFGAINNLRLRDSERMNRIELGNQLLNPFLEREQQASLFQQGEAGQTSRLQMTINAQAAQQALEQSGLDRRLGQTTAAQMQLALLNGDIATQQQLLTEAGADRRQAADIAADLNRTRITAQNQLLSTLIGAGGGGTSTGRTPVAPPGTNNVATGQPGWASSVAGVSAPGSSGQNVFGSPVAYNPAARNVRSGTSGGANQYTTYINQILSSYGLQ